MQRIKWSVEHIRYEGIRPAVLIPVVVMCKNRVVKTIDAGLGDKIKVNGNEYAVDIDTDIIHIH